MDVATPLIIALIGGGGLIGAVVALMKVRPENNAAVVTAAQGAVLIQTGLMEQLRSALEETRQELAAERAARRELEEKMTTCTGRVDELERALAARGD